MILADSMASPYARRHRVEPLEDRRLLAITDKLTVTGPGQSLLTIDAGGGTGYRIFEIDGSQEERRTRRPARPLHPWNGRVG